MSEIFLLPTVVLSFLSFYWWCLVSIPGRPLLPAVAQIGLVAVCIPAMVMGLGLLFNPDRTLDVLTSVPRRPDVFIAIPFIAGIPGVLFWHACIPLRMFFVFLLLTAGLLALSVFLVRLLT